MTGTSSAPGEAGRLDARPGSGEAGDTLVKTLGWELAPAGVPVNRIAPGMAFLANPDIGAMVGQILQVNGGEVRCRG